RTPPSWRRLSRHRWTSWSGRTLPRTAGSRHSGRRRPAARPGSASRRPCRRSQPSARVRAALADLQRRDRVGDLGRYVSDAADGVTRGERLDGWNLEHLEVPTVKTLATGNTIGGVADVAAKVTYTISALEIS